MDIKYNRKTKEDLPVVAICYDFDKTLSPDDMQAQGYIQSVGYDVAQFWKDTNDFAEQNDMDVNLAYMFKMVQEAEGKLIFNRDKLAEYGSQNPRYGRRHPCSNCGHDNLCRYHYQRLYHV